MLSNIRFTKKASHTSKSRNKASIGSINKLNLMLTFTKADLTNFNHEKNDRSTRHSSFQLIYLFLQT